MKELISTSTTKFKKGQENRNNNIELAAKAINNVQLLPNEEFSFNNIVGERTKAKGYKEANTIYNKKIIQSVGGGICQVSTTLNMAVKKARLKVTEVHIHSIPISYAKRVDEAAVSWGELDYKFMNNTKDIILIETKYDDKRAALTINLYKV